MDRQGQCEEALDRVNELLTRLVTRAEDLSATRCPYRNRLNQCAAEFACPNQGESRGPGYLPECTGDLYLNRRSGGIRP